MRELLKIEALLNDIYNISDPNNVNLNDEEKNRAVFIKSIEALENFEPLRKLIKKLVKDYTRD